VGEALTAVVANPTATAEEVARSGDRLLSALTS
jgi:hypothetical protein